MNDQIQQLNRALPDLINALNQVLAAHNLIDLSVDRLDFKNQPPVDAMQDGNMMELERSMELNDDIQICPPEDQIHGCITCINPVTGAIMHICKP